MAARGGLCLFRGGRRRVSWDCFKLASIQQILENPSDDCSVASEGEETKAALAVFRPRYRPLEHSDRAGPSDRAESTESRSRRNSPTGRRRLFCTGDRSLGVCGRSVGHRVVFAGCLGNKSLESGAQSGIR